MNFLKKHKWEIFCAVSLVAILIATFFIDEPQETMIGVEIQCEETEKPLSAKAENLEVTKPTKTPEALVKTEEQSKASPSPVPQKTQGTDDFKVLGEETHQEMVTEPTNSPDLKPEESHTPIIVATIEPKEVPKNFYREEVKVSTTKAPTQVPKKESTQKPSPEPAKSPTVTPTKSPEPSPGADDKKLLCTLEVRCDTILKNIELVEKEKRDIIPKNGAILPVCEIEFEQDETVFDVLKRVLLENKIHLEFEGTTIYDSVYIEGIGNIYEFDGGDMSGWLYKVNGKVPSVGCSQYTLKTGDKIEFLYTCNMGLDL